MAENVLFSKGRFYLTVYLPPDTTVCRLWPGYEAAGELAFRFLEGVRVIHAIRRILDSNVLFHTGFPDSSTKTAPCALGLMPPGHAVPSSPSVYIASLVTASVISAP